MDFSRGLMQYNRGGVTDLVFCMASKLWLRIDPHLIVEEIACLAHIFQRGEYIIKGHRLFY